ncbi:hypothetical protein R84981_000143 [Carnimonas sp. R-84981]|uniref:2OG-Fe(II) oxygenase n=1 Tax=Carnimonas bestiolae TaxID=3402172 RepID=UPI003EDC5A5B
MTQDFELPAALNSAVMEQLIDGLAESGYAVIRHALPVAQCRALALELNMLRHQQELSSAGIGRGRQHVQRSDIRGDRIHWLDRSTEAQRHYFAMIESLRTEINRQLFLGLFELEAHFAFYPPGSFYKCHFDSFAGRSNRVVSSVLYLNEAWPKGSGGEMALYPQSDQLPDASVTPLEIVAPELGTLACFLSERVPHEVLPTRLPRLSIAGWFRRNASIGGTIDPEF